MPKSPSRIKRDMLRLKAFNTKKKEEELLNHISELENKLRIKSSTIFKLEVQISNLKFKLLKPKKKLSIMQVQTTDIPPALPPSFNSSERKLNTDVR